jgi:hypothetical protein
MALRLWGLVIRMRRGCSGLRVLDLASSQERKAHRPQGERRKKEGGMGEQEVPRNPLVAFTH